MTNPYASRSPDRPNTFLTFLARDGYDVQAWWISGAFVTGILGLWLTALWIHSVDAPITTGSTPADVLREDAQRPMATHLVRFTEHGMDVEMLATGERPARMMSLSSDGFVVTLVRTQNRERRRLGLPLDAPFRVSRWNNGQILFEDPEMGTQIDLSAFGATNAAAFTALVEGKK